MTKKIKGIVPGPRPKKRESLLDVSWIEEAEAVPMTNLPYFGIIDKEETDERDRS